MCVCTYIQIHVYVYIHFCCYSLTKDMSDSLQHARLPCTSLSHGVCLNSSLNQLCHPSHLLLPSIFSSIRIFSSEWVLRIGSQNTRASASACPSNEYSRLISFRISWFDFLAVQGTLKSMADSCDVWQNPLQCCGVVSLQLVKINEKKNF